MKKKISLVEKWLFKNTYGKRWQKNELFLSSPAK